MRELTFPLCGQAWPVHVAERPEDLSLFLGWVRDQRGYVAVDTETRGLDVLKGDPDYVRTIQFGTATEAWVIPSELGGPFRDAARRALEILPKVVGHNYAGFDAVALSAHLGLDLDLLCKKSQDTQILAKLVDPRQPMEGGIGAGLKPLSAYFIDPDAPDTQAGLTAVFRSLGLTKETGWAGIDLFNPTYLSYAGGDVILTARLLPILVGELDRLAVPEKLRVYEHEISRICAHMQYRGMLLDQDYTRTLDSTLEAESEKYAAVAARYGVDSVNSNRQLAEALIGMGETIGATPATRTASGAPKLDKPVMLELADLNSDWKRVGARTPNPLADAVLHSKRAGKWRSAYARTFLETADTNGRIHPMINTLQARTGRMSITRPALQTLPSNDWMIRRCLLAEEGHVMVSTDFQAVEMRVLAALADVKAMKHGFQNADSYPKDEYPNGFDIHMFTARLVKGPNATKADRKMFKGAGFGKVYGGGYQGVARQTGADPEDMRRTFEEYDRVFPEIKRASNRWQREARQTGMVSVSVTGRRLPLDRDRTYAVVNYLTQSAARDVLGQSMINMEAGGLLPYMRLPIHDEVLASVPKESSQEIAREIEKCMTFSLFGVPITAGAEVGGRSWGSLYSADF
jgi:DNA polymerase-1